MAALIPISYTLTAGSTMVGGSTPWGDDSDATYVDVQYNYTVYNDSGVRGTCAMADAQDIDLSNIKVRVSAPAANAPNSAYFQFRLFDTSDFNPSIGGASVGLVGTEPTTYTLDMSDYDWAKPALVTALRAGTLGLSVALSSSGPLISGHPVHLYVHDVILNEGTFPPLSGVVLNDPDEDGWYGGWDHGLVEWDDTHVAAMFSDASLGGGGVRMITSDPSSGEVTLGPKTKYYLDSDESEQYTHDEAKIGDLLVQFRRDNNRLYTLRYDSATNTFTPVGTYQTVVFNPGSYQTGARIIPWSQDTMLLVQYRSTDVSTSQGGTSMFARWSGTEWEFSPATISNAYSFGSTDYLGTTRIIDQADPAAPTALVFALTSDGYRYATITGDYPNAPNVTVTPQVPTGHDDYYNWQWWSAPAAGYQHAIRTIPVLTGTLTPVPGGSSSFDWAVMTLTLDGGVITEGPLTTIGPADSFYDIWMTETSDGHLWAAWSLPGTPTKPPLAGPRQVGVRDVTDPASITNVIEDPDDGGVYTGDYSTRTMARAGNRVVVAWMTRTNQKLPVISYGRVLIPLAQAIEANLLLVDQRFM